MDAREWLASVMLAAGTARYEQRWADLQRERALGFSQSLMPRVHSGASDPMRAIDALVDGERDHADRLSCALAELAEASRVFQGMRSIGLMEREAADVMELYSIHLLTLPDIARGLAISVSTAERRKRFGLDWLDANGFAHAKASTGTAT